MKKGKIIGLLVATGGVISSFAAAAALYVKGVSKTGFGIGSSYEAEDGTITYKIDGKTSGSITPSFLDDDGHNGGTKFSEVYTQAVYKFPLSAHYNTSIPQPYVVGNFSVSITNIDSRLHNKAKVWAEVKDWEADQVWGSSDANKNFFDSDQTISAASMSFSKDITVYSAQAEDAADYAKRQSVYVYVKLQHDDLKLTNTLALAETVPFTLTARWGAPSASYKFAYVVGPETAWTEDEAFAMVPNIKSDSGFEWYFEGLTGFTKAKCEKEGLYSAGDDATLNSTKKYNVTWKDSHHTVEDHEVADYAAYFAGPFSA